ncbi:hypothetical protein Aduo_009232 [Ancylostoma duodenale]
MLRIAKELSESRTDSFSIFEDSSCKCEEGPLRRTVHVQTEISCDHAKLSTELTIRHDESQHSSESGDVVFWRAVATQRASELDILRESIEKVRIMTDQNVKEKLALDEKHDALYSQLQAILQNSGSESSSSKCEEQPS